MAFAGPGHPGSELPDLDDRLVEPETPFEVLDGEVIYVAPADEPHATLHVQIAALIEAHTGLDFEVACDMLTRTSEVDDTAPDVSVFPLARHPETGRRQLEQLAFEVVSTETISYAGRKAAKLATRGLRRIFAIDVERERALEWSVALGTWSILDPHGVIEDPTLDVPLPIQALIRTARSDDAVARALLAKGNPVLEQRRAEDQAQAQARALLTVLDARGVLLSEAERAHILAERDIERITRWLTRAATCITSGEVLELP